MPLVMVCGDVKARHDKATVFVNRFYNFYKCGMFFRLLERKGSRLTSLLPLL